jgi:hypothetical protein
LGFHPGSRSHRSRGPPLLRRPPPRDHHPYSRRPRPLCPYRLSQRCRR